MTSNVVVFLGPTLDRATASSVLPATYLPPASQGDVLRACYARPAAIAIVDGYFDRVPSVWHKEVLWALNQGIPVFGSSSMGALRAAELADFGMRGVGTVYRHFREGTYEDDDEVAVSHAAEEHGFRCLSEAMVNIRATIARAVGAGVIDERTSSLLLGVAKRLFYPERHYATILRLARPAGVSSQQLLRFEAWLPANQVDQKRGDALELLTLLSGYAEEGFPSPTRKEGFAYTSSWNALLRQSAPQAPSAAGALALQHELLLDELILAERYRASHAAALTRALALALSTRHVQPQPLSAEAVNAASAAFRSENQQLEGAAFERWIEEQRLDVDSLSDFFSNQARFVRSLQVYGTDLLPHLVDALRADGSFSRFAERAERKLIAFEGDPPKDSEQSGLDERALWGWFRQRVGRELPGDLAAYAGVAHGLPRERVLLAISREYCYWQREQSRARADAGSDKP